MRYNKSLLVSIIVCVCLTFSAAFSSDVRHRRFTDQEIKYMAAANAVIETRLGAIKLRFFPEDAPNHVNNFIELAKTGFYDGVTFHRIIPGFMIQGGCPNSKERDRSKHGMGGPGYALKAEFNKLPHTPGTLSMARSRHPDSGGSQFFICAAHASHLDGKYTVFGEVVQGMDVVNKIVAQKRDRRDNPLERIEMKVRVTAPKKK